MGARIDKDRRALESAHDEARDDAAEAGVLASMLLLGKAESKPALSEGDFSNEARRTIWRAMERLRRAKKPIDVTLLVGELKDMNLYGDSRDSADHVDCHDLWALFRLLPHHLNRDQYAARVREMTTRRAALARAERELARGKGKP